VPPLLLLRRRAAQPSSTELRAPCSLPPSTAPSAGIFLAPRRAPAQIRWRPELGEAAVAARALGGGGGGGGPGRYFFTHGWIDFATEVPAVAPSCMDGSIWWRRFRSLPPGAWRNRFGAIFPRRRPTPRDLGRTTVLRLGDMALEHEPRRPFARRRRGRRYGEAGGFCKIIGLRTA
jgi:hypothetical protein